MASQAQPQQLLLPVFLGLLVLVILFLILPSLNLRVNIGTQTQSEGQCISNGKSFNAQAEAFTLAQEAEQYRFDNPSQTNYGLGSYTICFNDGTQERFQSDVFKGYSITPPETSNISHSEQSTYGWLQNELSKLAFDQGKVNAIYTIIFSQVIVCEICKENMKSWRCVLRSRARTNKVALSIWDIRRGKGFAPSKYPAGTGTPVISADLERVDILFHPC